MTLPAQHRLFLFCTLLPGYFASVYWMGQHGPIGKFGFVFVFIFVLSSCMALLLWHWWPQTSKSLILIFGIAAVTRLQMLPFPATDDMNRYIWEGQIQNQGYNPYQIAPDNDELKFLRDTNWEGINHKHIPAIYPPLAQLIFRATAFFFRIPCCIQACFYSC